MHLYQSDNQLFLSANIKNVVSHITHTSPSGSLHAVTLLDDSTLVRMEGRLYNLKELTTHYKAKARNEGVVFSDKLSINVRGKVINVIADKTKTLTHLLIDRIAEGQKTFAYDDYAHDYTKHQFVHAIHRVKEKIDLHIKRQDKKYYLKHPIAYHITPIQSPQHHQKITLSQTTPNFETITA